MNSNAAPFCSGVTYRIGLAITGSASNFASHIRGRFGCRICELRRFENTRPELAKLLRAIEPVDVLLVTRLDRLARSTRDLLNVLDAVARAKAGFRSLKDACAGETLADIAKTYAVDPTTIGRLRPFGGVSAALYASCFPLHSRRSRFAGQLNPD
jgi:hypothetical protein